MTTILPDLKTGDRVRLNGSHQRRAWAVTARTDEHIILLRQAPFHPKGMHEYTIIAERDHPYNGVRAGLVRSSLNTLGGGWDIDGRVGEGTREMIDALESGEFELSNRRLFPVNEVEVAA